MKAVEVTKRDGESGIRRWDPFDRLSEPDEELWAAWGRLLPAVPRSIFGPLWRLGSRPSRWMRTADVFEKDGRLFVQVDLPGLSRDDVEVTLEGGSLVIRGERQEARAIDEEGYYRQERCRGSFFRRVPLGFEVKPEDVEATFEDDILEVSLPLPKSKEPQASQVKIR